MPLFRTRSDTIQTIVGILVLAIAGAGLYFAVRHYQRVESENQRIAAANAAIQKENAAAEEQARRAEADWRFGRSSKTASKDGPSGAGPAPPAAGKARAERTAANAPPRYAHKLHVNLEILGEVSGVIAYSDTTLVFDEKLRQGATRKVEADKELKLIVDEPQAVQIKVNGELFRSGDRSRNLIVEVRWVDGHVTVSTLR